MKKQIFTIVTTILLLVCFSINVFSENEIVNTEDTNSINETTNKTLIEQAQDVNDKITESNNKLEYVQSELTTAVQKIQELDDSIKEYENQYNQLQAQVQQMETEISQTEEKLTTVQAEYDKKQNTLKKRTVAMYEAGNATYLDVLLSSKSLSDFLSNYFILEQIIEFDSSLLDDLSEKEKEIELAKAKQEQQKSDIRAAKAKAGQMKVLMENNKMLQENYMLKLTDEEKALQEQINTYKIEQAAIENQIQSVIQWSGALSIQFSGGVMVWPVGISGTYITSGYGNRLHPIQGVYKSHDGIDIGNAGFGAPIVAAADGIVTYAGTMGGYGNCVMITHGSGIVTLYGHGQEIKATLGATVKQGDIIMTVGSTGNSTGPHLHFEVRKDGAVVDPIPYLQGDSNEDQSEQNQVTDIN